jgi:hypothetical protein
LPAGKAIPEKRAIAIPPAVVIVGIVLLAGLAAFVYLDHAAKQPAAPPPPLTSEARTYVRSLKLSDVQMEAHESYMKQSIVEITGKIENAGDRTLRLVEINCVFYDAYGQVVLRERVPIVKQNNRLAPAEIKSFRLPFDNVPESWNQAMPQMVIAHIDF